MLERTRIRKEKQRKKLKNAIRGILFVMLIVLLFVVILGTTQRDRTVLGYDYVTGNSLWELSVNCPDNMDRRDYICEIMILNAMNDTKVYKGRLYQVPIYE